MKTQFGLLVFTLAGNATAVGTAEQKTPPEPSKR
jgi:hypothetical protein